MPRAKKSKKQFEFSTEFVRCELDADDKKKFAAWSKNPGQTADDLLIEVLQANHKVSYSFSDHNDSFIVSVTGKPEDCDNAKKCYTSHAKDPITAFWVAMYKYHVIWNKEPWEASEETEDFG